MEFKVGDKVRKKSLMNFYNGEPVATVENVRDGLLWLKETQTFIREFEAELVEEEKEMTTHEYGEGKWYMWGGGECPLHPEDKFQAWALNDYNGNMHTVYNAIDQQWEHNERFWKILAFKITKKYVPPVTKEMTIEEISKALGYDVKVVKG